MEVIVKGEASMGGRQRGNRSLRRAPSPAELEVIRSLALRDLRVNRWQLRAVELPKLLALFVFLAGLLWIAGGALHALISVAVGPAYWSAGTAMRSLLNSGVALLGLAALRVSRELNGVTTRLLNQERQLTRTINRVRLSRTVARMERALDEYARR